MNSKLNSPYEINKNIQILKCDLSNFPNEELNNQVNKIQPPPKNDSHPQLEGKYTEWPNPQKAENHACDRQSGLSDSAPRNHILVV